MCRVAAIVITRKNTQPVCRVDFACGLLHIVLGKFAHDKKSEKGTVATNLSGPTRDAVDQFLT